MEDVLIPKAENWENRVGAPGYFVTKDGRLQMLKDDDGGFVICTMKENGGKGI